MNKKLLAALISSTLVIAGCGGGSGGGSSDNPTTDTSNPTGPTTPTNPTNPTNPITPVTEDRSRPVTSTVISSSLSGSSVVSNGSTGQAGTGPVINNSDQPNNFPLVAVGDFLWVNNAFNFNNTNYDDWFQQVELTGSDGNLVPSVSYDWGNEGDLRNEFATSSFPELIYGVKSAAETSGSFASTGLPIENALLPNEINISYDYSYTQGVSGSTTPDSNVDNSGFNVAIESFWHDSCDIVREGSAADNQVFELMVWLHIGKRGPSAEGRNGSVGTFTSSDGRTFDVFSKTDAFFRGETGVRNFLAFVAQEETFTGTVPYHEFVNEAINNTEAYGTGWRNLTDTDCLANILLGSEVWYGAAQFQWNDVTIEQLY